MILRYKLISLVVLATTIASSSAAQQKPITTIVPAQSANVATQKGVSATSENQHASTEPNDYTDDKSIQPKDRPPESGLGLQVTPPQVVYPASQQIVEETLTDLESLQLTPEQSNRLKEINLERNRQKSSPYVSPPNPVTRTLLVNLNAGVTPPTIRLATGQLSTIVFSDTNGQAWNINRVSINCVQFNSALGCEKEKDAEQTNIITIEPKQPTAYGNITVTLNGLSTPVIFILTSGQKDVDMRVDAKLTGHNPDAEQSISLTGMPSIDSEMTSFLDGVPPKNAKRLKVTGLDDVEAWVYNDAMYVRANANAQYPAYISAGRSTTGMSIYKYAQTYSNVTFTTGGRAVTVSIESIDTTSTDK
ncbi:DotH/IcmK family type IV secretion protein [Yersinia enterocolitica]